MRPADGDVVRVVIVSRVRFHREGLEQILPRLGPIEIAGTGADIGQVMTRFPVAHPDVVLLDAATPSTSEIVHDVHRLWPDAGVIAAAIGHDDDDVVRWAEAGVAGFITRDQSLTDVAAMIASVADGEAPCDGRIGATLLRRLTASATAHTVRQRERLTRRERQVAELVGQGCSNKEIASRLCIGLPTVKHHVHAVLHKLELVRRAEVSSRLLMD